MVNTKVYMTRSLLLLLSPRSRPRRGQTLEAEAEAKTLEAEARTLEAEAEATKFWPREAKARPRGLTSLVVSCNQLYVKLI